MELSLLVKAEAGKGDSRTVLGRSLGTGRVVLPTSTPSLHTKLPATPALFTGCTHDRYALPGTMLRLRMLSDVALATICDNRVVPLPSPLMTCRRTTARDAGVADLLAQLAVMSQVMGCALTSLPPGPSLTHVTVGASEGAQWGGRKVLG